MSYKIVGILYQVHNQLGRFAREKQYCDLIEKLMIELKIPYIREYVFNDSGNRVDFLIDDKIILEVKAERMITKDDYHQIQRYLQSLDKKLGLMVNFHTHYLAPKRIVRIETDIRKKFL